MGVTVNQVFLYLLAFPSNQIETLMNRVQTSKATDLREILIQFLQLYYCQRSSKTKTVLY